MSAVPGPTRGAESRALASAVIGGVLPSGGSMIMEVRYSPLMRDSIDPRSSQKSLYAMIRLYGPVPCLGGPAASSGLGAGAAALATNALASASVKAGLSLNTAGRSMPVSVAMYQTP